MRGRGGGGGGCYISVLVRWTSHFAWSMLTQAYPGKTLIGYRVFPGYARMHMDHFLFYFHLEENATIHLKYATIILKSRV